MQENHTIHLNNMVRIPRTRFANKVLYAVKNYVKKHTRAAEKNIRISNEVNAAIFARGIQHKLNSIDVAFKKKEDLLYVFLQNGKELKAFTEKAKPVEKKGAAKKEAKAEEKKAEAPTKATNEAKVEAHPKKAATAPAK